MRRQLSQTIAILGIGTLAASAAWAQTETVTYFHTDAIGSVRMITDATGTVERHDYLPFGEEWLPPSPNDERRLFGGKERDKESALDYFGARYYSGGSGRFGTPDLAPGVVENPQSWNRYAYVLNNPLRYIDPTGLYEWSVECADQECEDNRQKFRDAYAQVGRTFAQTRLGSEEYRVLKDIIDKIGTEGDGNKVRVAFSATQEDFGDTLPTGPNGRLMRFNFSAVESVLASAGYDSDAIGLARASLVVHEGRHAAEGLSFAARWLLTFGQTKEGERRAYGAESLFYRTLSVREPFGPLWDPSWPAAQQEMLRLAAIQAMVRRR